MHVTKTENLCDMQTTITAEKRMQYKAFLLWFLFCSYIRNWVLLILLNTRDYHNNGTRKCAENIDFVKEIKEQKLFCVRMTDFDSMALFSHPEF
jgi:hypothetical protein